MKKLITIILILAMLLPAAALADYTPALEMYVDDFLMKYNAISAPIGSPYEKIEKSYDFSSTSEYRFQWYKPAKDSSVVIFLGTKDTQFVNSGIDIIQIGTSNSKDFLDLISIATRCSDIFASDLFGTKLSGMQVNNVIRYYYENGLKGKTMLAYNILDTDEKYAISFFESDGWYTFQISTMEAIK